MARYRWLVFTNCAPGRDEEFNRWYDEIHLDDLRRVPGITRAYRLGLAPVQATISTGEAELCGPEEIGARHRYLAIYEIDADDPGAVLREVQLRANTPEMVISPYLTDAYTVLYHDL